MYPLPQESPQHDALRVLASATTDGQEVAMLERGDGCLIIRVDGADIPEFRWPPDQVDRCVQAYLRLLRP